MDFGRDVIAIRKYKSYIAGKILFLLNGTALVLHYGASYKCNILKSHTRLETIWYKYDACHPIVSWKSKSTWAIIEYLSYIILVIIYEWIINGTIRIFFTLPYHFHFRQKICKQNLKSTLGVWPVFALKRKFTHTGLAPNSPLRMTATDRSVTHRAI